jgi:Phycobilisome protein
MALSEQVMMLISKSRIMDFQAWSGDHSPETIAMFQAADDAKLYLNDQQLEVLMQLDPKRGAALNTVGLLRDRAAQIIDEARTGVLLAFPEILEPGGGLYPSERAKACWNDFWQFLRCITYGIAGSEPNYTSALGLHHMELLYRELSVPLDAMIVGLKGIKKASLNQSSSEQQVNLAPYFDHLIEQLEGFR